MGGRGQRSNGQRIGGPRLEIPMAPTLRPTKQEWEDPIRFIRKVKSEGYHKYGIVKIVPPESWRPPFAINKETFKFSTRVQSINELQRRHIIAAKSRAFSKKVTGFLPQPTLALFWITDPDGSLLRLSCTHPPSLSLSEA